MTFAEIGLSPAGAMCLCMVQPEQFTCRNVVVAAPAGKKFHERFSRTRFGTIIDSNNIALRTLQPDNGLEIDPARSVV